MRNNLFVGDRGNYCGNCPKIPKTVIMEVVESKAPVAVRFRADDGRNWWFSGDNFRKLGDEAPHYLLAYRRISFQ